MKPNQHQQFWMIARLPTSPQAEPQPRKVYRNRAVAEANAQRLATDTGVAYALLSVEEVVTPKDGHRQERMF